MVRRSSLQVRLRTVEIVIGEPDQRSLGGDLQRDRVSRVRRAGMIVRCRWGTVNNGRR